MAWQPIQSQGRCVYTVRTGSIIPTERAQEIGEYIEDLEDNFEITPHNILDDARRKNSKLHEFFEWDDDVAGERWRLQQARSIVNHFEIKIVDLRSEDETTTRAWHSVSVIVENPTTQSSSDNGDSPDSEAPEDEPEPEPLRAYVNVRRVMSEEYLRRQVVENALREAQNWRRRYSTYSELQPIFSAIETMADGDGKK